MALRRTLGCLSEKKLGTAAAYYDRPGRFSDLIRKVIPASTWEQMKDAVLFRPNDTHDLHQMWPANMTTEKVPRIKGYRYPAPGSQASARVPDTEDEDRRYDIKYFTRNVRRQGHLDEKGRSTRFADRQIAQANALVVTDGDEPPIGSPGTHYTLPAVQAYDPTGLRSAMTANHEETYKAVQAHLANHNVMPAWKDRTDEIAALTTGKGLPPVPGYDFDDNIVPESKTAAW
uniref:Uncharacterized protein n=1 Tax=Florenciella parvula TaxID=236787 RepID=A0A7S2CFD6_9STRA